MKLLLYALVAYLIIRYLLRPLLMAIVVKSAGKMMKDMQERAQQGNYVAPEKRAENRNEGSRDVSGEYIDYEEVK